MYIYIYISYINTLTPFVRNEKNGWIPSIKKISQNATKRRCRGTPTPEAMGFDLDLEVLPSAMDVWAIEEKALIAADGPMVRHQLMME